MFSPLNKLTWRSVYYLFDCPITFVSCLVVHHFRGYAEFTDLCMFFSNSWKLVLWTVFNHIVKECGKKGWASYWYVANSGRWGCISGRQMESCRCWECRLWPPGWACSCAPAHRVTHTHKVCLETSPHLHCKVQTNMSTTTCFRKQWRILVEY